MVIYTIITNPIVQQSDFNLLHHIALIKLLFDRFFPMSCKPTCTVGVTARGGQDGQVPTLEKVRVGHAHLEIPTVV